jgi:hypothetical protein
MKKGVGTNRYAYAFNDPINFSDPSGHAVFSVTTTHANGSQSITYSDGRTVTVGGANTTSGSNGGGSNGGNGTNVGGIIGWLLGENSGGGGGRPTNSNSSIPQIKPPDGFRAVTYTNPIGGTWTVYKDDKGNRFEQGSAFGLPYAGVRSTDGSWSSIDGNPTGFLRQSTIDALLAVDRPNKHLGAGARQFEIKLNLGIGDQQEALGWKKKLREICFAAMCWWNGETYEKIELPPPLPKIEIEDKPK